MVYKIFDKTSTKSGVDTSFVNKSATKPNYQLANELHKKSLENVGNEKFIHFLETIFWMLI